MRKILLYKAAIICYVSRLAALRTSSWQKDVASYHILNKASIRRVILEKAIMSVLEKAVRWTLLMEMDVIK